jgi:hypothetical protein
MRVDVYRVGSTEGPLWKRMLSLVCQRRAVRLSNGEIIVSRVVIRPWQAEMNSGVNFLCSCNCQRGWTVSGAEFRMVTHHARRVERGECPTSRDHVHRRLPVWWSVIIGEAKWADKHAKSNARSSGTRKNGRT